MNTKNPKVDFYFTKEEKWKQEIKKLRDLVLSCGLQEELKWGCPCYVMGKSNIVLIHVFKEYCALLLFKGALLKNDHGLLIQQSEQVQAARQIRFKALSDIKGKEDLIKSVLFEAIEVEKSGQKVVLKKVTEYAVADEFKHKLKEMPELKKAFEALTPGRQRAYLLHFAAPKQAKTREARVEKYIPQILSGKGLND